MRILILHSKYVSGPVSGENRVVDDEARLLRTAGHQVLLVDPEPETGGLLDGVRLAASATWSRQGIGRVRQAIGEFRPDVAHVHNLFPMLSPAVLRFMGKHGIVVLQTLHNYRMLCLPATLLRKGRVCELCVGRSLWRGVAFRCYRHSLPASAALAGSITLHRFLDSSSHVRLFLAVSDYVRGKHVEAGVIPPSAVRVKPNFAWAIRSRRKPGRYFLYLGWLAQGKGPDVILKAWRHEFGRLLIAGDGPDASRLMALGVPNVEFLGPVAPSVGAKLLQNARALVVPSLLQEPAARVVIEAYAAGVPVLASRVGGLPEVVSDGVSGLLLPPGEAAAWEDGLRQLTDNRVTEHLGQGAYHLWKARYTPETGLANLEAVYQEAIQLWEADRKA